MKHVLLAVILLLAYSELKAATRAGVYLGLAEFDDLAEDTVTLGGIVESPIGGHVFLGAQAEYWDLDYKFSDDSLRDLSVAPYAKVYVPNRSGVTPYLKGGMGLHLIKKTTNGNRDDKQDLSLDLGTGILVSLPGLALKVEYQVREFLSVEYSQFMVSTATFF